MEYSTADPSRMAFMIPHVIFWAVRQRITEDKEQCVWFPHGFPLQVLFA